MVGSMELGYVEKGQLQIYVKVHDQVLKAVVTLLNWSHLSLGIIILKRVKSHRDHRIILGLVRVYILI